MPEKVPLAYHFLEPLYKTLEHSSFTRKCPKHTDRDFLEADLSSSLSQVASGRDFLQPGFDSPGNSWKISTYFESLKSKRRASLVVELAAMLAGGVRNSHSAWQWSGDLPELDGFGKVAGDGHFHKAATHDPKGPKGRLVPVGQFFARNMRSGALHHLGITVPTEGNTGEHDISIASIAYNLLLLMKDRLRAVGDLPADVRQEEKEEKRRESAATKTPYGKRGTPGGN